MERAIFASYENGKEVKIKRQSVLTQIDANYWAGLMSTDGDVNAISIKLGDDVLRKYLYKNGKPIGYIDY